MLGFSSTLLFSGSDIRVVWFETPDSSLGHRRKDTDVLQLTFQVKHFFCVQTCCSKEWGHFLFFWRFLSLTPSSVCMFECLYVLIISSNLYVFQHVLLRDLDVTFFISHQTQNKHKEALPGWHTQHRVFAQMATLHYTKTITQGD